MKKILRLKKILNYGYLHFETESERTKYALINLFSLVGIVSLLSFGSLYLKNDSVLQGTVEISLGLCGIINLIYLNIKKKIELPATVTLLIMYVTLMFLITNGGIGGSGILWFYTFPPLTFFLVGRRYGALWIIFTLLSISFLLLLQLEYPNIIYYDITFIRQFIFTFLILSLFIFIFQYIVEDVHSNLAVEKDKLDSILRSIDDAVFAVDQDMKIIMFNFECEKLTRYQFHEVKGKPYTRFIKILFENNRSLNTQFVKQSVKKGLSFSMSHSCILIDRYGEEIPITYSSAPTNFGKNNSKGAVVVIRNITKERLIDKAKSEFVSLASHQLRTPLTSINWYTELLLSGEYGKLKSDQLNLLKELNASGKRMSQLVNDLLNVSRLEAGKLAIEPKPGSIYDALDSVINELEPIAQKRDVKIKLVDNHKSKKGLQLKYDDQLLHQLIFNILSNAIKYSKTVNPKVEVTISESRDGFTISIADNGIGIPADNREHLFEKFYRAENATKVDGEGSGLGLYLAKMIADQSGCELRFESKVDVGTTFYIFIPASGMKEKGGGNRLIK